MNWDHVAASWDQFKERIQRRWGKLTGHQLEVIAGSRVDLCEKIQESYGISEVVADQQVDEWQAKQNKAAYLIERATERNGAPQ
jgi:uncharacterized protein YjbJ (UPF0337 family)